MICPIGSLRACLTSSLDRITVFGRPLSMSRPRTAACSSSLSAHEGQPKVIPLDRLRRHDRLGGLIHEYHLAA